MKKTKRSETGLVVEHLENISRTAIKPWRDSGKYIVLLREKTKRIGPIGFSSKINIQAPRLALMARLTRARTLADAL
jgi:hypothetical protein